MKPAPFEYHRAYSVDQALRLRSQLGDHAEYIAGGQSLLPMMNLRLAQPVHVIDISRIESLRSVEIAADRVRLGANVTHATIERGAIAAPLRAAMPGLAELMGNIGNVAIRSRGTIGGSLAHADPAAEWLLFASLLDIRIRLAAPGGAVRWVDAAEFFIGFMETSRDPGELLTAVEWEILPGQTAFRSFARSPGDYAVASAGIVIQLDGSGQCTRLRIAVGCLATGVRRFPELESQAEGRGLTASDISEIAQQVAKRCEPTGDVNGSEEYKRNLIASVVEQALRHGTTTAEEGR